MRRLRLLLVLSLPVALAGCRDLIVLDDLQKPFACTPSHLDGGLGDPDGGSQCGAGWRCGSAGRCFSPFDTDGGRDWACELDEQCFDGWTCGPRVGETRRCQRVGVGAPSACLVGEADAGCQGGWRCGADARCFDPANPADGGERDCTESTQCPNGFRCGQRVDERQRCIRVGVDAGAPVPCTSDEGCEGGWRCDTREQVCALVTDVVTSGRGEQLSAARISPLTDTLPLPRHFSATAPTRIAADELGARNLGSPPIAVTWSALYDGGAWVTTHLERSYELEDGGRRLLVRRWVPVAGQLDDVRHFATEHHALHVLWRDGGLSRWDSVAPVRGAPATETRDPRAIAFLRQVAAMGQGLPPLNDAGTFPLLVHVGWRETNGFTDPDGGFVVTTRFMVGPPTAPSNSTPFPWPLWDAVPTLMGTTLGFHDGGLSVGFQYLARTDELPLPPLGLTETNVRSVRTGLVRGSPNVVFELARPAGGATLVGVATEGINFASVSGPVAACPDAGELPDQVAFADSEGRTGALVRCQRASLFRAVASGSGFAPYPEDQLPFAGPLVSDRTATLGRSHAGAEGRAWTAMLRDGGAETGSMADRRLLPELLDRQPDVMVGFSERGQQRTFAPAGDWLFVDEPGVGLVSDYGSLQSSFRPLSVVASNRLWVVANQGMLDLSTTQATGGSPRQLAVAPVDGPIAAPAIADAVTLTTAAGPREVVLVASGDRLLAVDVTQALPQFGQPGTFETVLVPAPGIKLRGLTINRTALSSTIDGYVTTGTATWRFGTSDLVNWSLEPVQLPRGSALATELWAEDGRPRLGLADGTVWALPIAVQLSEPLLGADGGGLTTAEYGRKCGDLFATTREGAFHLGARLDGGLPAWRPLTAINASVDVLDGLRLYEVHDTLVVVSRAGRAIELRGTFPQADGGTCR